MTGDAEEILTRAEDSVRFLILNRPKAMNSLTHSTVTTMHSVLAEWERDDDVRLVVLAGAGDRGLCAGGGVGVGAHANIRVVTDTTKMAMPEVGIALVPDVGGTYLLSRAPGKLGPHAALTGAPFSGSDAVAMGLADHYVPHEALEDFTKTIVNNGVQSALEARSVSPPFSERVAQRSWIDESYDGETVADLVAALRGHDAGPAEDAANLIATRSPTSLEVTLEAVRRAAQLDTLEDVLRQEYRVSCATLRSHDLVEGIRAQLIDKDRNPTWSPSSLSAVSRADVEAFFAPVENELSFEKGSNS